MLTCSTVRTKDSWQNDWSQGFRPCDQEELPYCDTCVKVPYQSHVWYSECGSTSAVPATHCCLAQMYLSMSHVFIIQRYLRLLAPCCNPTNHLKQMPYRDEYHFQVLKSPRMSVTSMMEMLWSNEKLGRLRSHYNQPTFCLMATQVFLPQKDYFHLRWKKSSGSNSYSKDSRLGTLLKKYFLFRQSEPMEVHFCWVMEWWHLLGLIRSMLKSI